LLLAAAKQSSSNKELCVCLSANRVRSDLLPWGFLDVTVTVCPIEGLTIAGCGNPTTQTGGGMFVSGAAPLIENVVFLQNSATSSGGGLTVCGEPCSRQENHRDKSPILHVKIGRKVSY
jgi:hypothetical protein